MGPAAPLLLLLLAAQSPATPAAAPMLVAVDVQADAGPELQEWARELRTALAARKGEFRLAKPKEKAELVVRLDSVVRREDGVSILALGCAVGNVKRSFSYSFTNVRTEAEKLARNLRGLADKMRADVK